VPNADDFDEERLIAAAQQGDRGAFDRLISHHGPRLLLLANRMLGNAADAEDAVQNAMASAWLALSRFDRMRPLAPWLTTIAINKCRDVVRRRRFMRLLPTGGDEAVKLIADDAPDQDLQMEKRELLDRVAREIVRLPLKLREPFVLVTFDGRTQADAAAILGVSEKAVETRIYRARMRLREKFSER
jgi:RNA polymerase sigma-70 factor (ECF subfamily)